MASGLMRLQSSPPGSEVRRERVATRSLTGTERMWLAADAIHPPFVNQMVLEGHGLPSAPGGDWTQVMERVCRAQPGWRMRLHGALGWTRWRADGPLPAVREVDGSAWSGLDGEGAPFLKDPLDPWRGPAAEVILVRGYTPRVVLRTHHALTDGQGALLFARAFFAVLRGQAPPVAQAGPLTDWGLARNLRVPPAPARPPTSVAPQGAAEDAPLQVAWHRLRVPNPTSPQGARFQKLVPRVALALARSALVSSGAPGPVQGALPVDATFVVGVPADLRGQVTGCVSTANLTGMVHLPVHEILARPDPLGELAHLLAQEAGSGIAAATPRAAGALAWVPLSLMVREGRRAIVRDLARQRFGVSAVLSNLGRLEPDTFSGGGFQARSAFFIPPGNPGLPLFLTLTGDPEGVELCATVPRALDTRDRTPRLLDSLARTLLDGAGGITFDTA